MYIRNAVVIIAALLILGSCAGSLDIRDRDAIGFLSGPTGHGPEITITPRTKWVNVAQYDVVTFVNPTTGKAFVWNFSVRSWGKFDLSAVAPPGFFSPGQQVTVYISEFVRMGARD